MTTYKIEKRYTRDHRAPLSEDDLDMECGWQCIPLPPEYDAGWKIFDTSKDYKTGWIRKVPVTNGKGTH